LTEKGASRHQDQWQTGVGGQQAHQTDAAIVFQIAQELAFGASSHVALPLLDGEAHEQLGGACPFLPIHTAGQ
jgi:hypothetical protein